MPADSAILAHTPDLATSLIAQTLPTGSPLELAEPDRAQVQKAFRVAEAKALVTLCDETLWNDFGLMPALLDEFRGDELAELGRKVLQPDGQALRQIRNRASSEVARLRSASTNSDEYPQSDSPLPAGQTPSISARYVEALVKWAAPTPLPAQLKKRAMEAWHPRFGAAFRRELKGIEALGALVGTAASPADDKRFDELSRQSWRLDEVLGKLDKWVRVNPGGVPGGASSAVRRSVSRDSGLRSIRRFLTAAAIALAIAAVMGAAFWIAFSSSPKIESLVAKVQTGRVTGVSERLARAAAWMDEAPIPDGVFTRRISALLEASAAPGSISAEAVDAALIDLQRKQLCRAVAGGWIFHEAVRNKFRHPDAVSGDWWQRALEMLLAAAPDDEERPESVEQWRQLLPHLIALFELAPNTAAAEPPMQSLLAALSKGLLANRIEPGRRPALSPESHESDALHKRISLFAEAATKYFDEGLNKIEEKYGRFSNEMVTAHRLLAELAWRNRQLKKEQDSWVRATRALEKQEPRDAREIAFCNLRLGISRAVAGSHEGAEEAFADALKVLREQQGNDHPQVGRMERKIARVYADLGQFELAWRHHQQALVVLMKAYPVATPEIAALHEEQGEFGIDYGRYEDGIGLLKRGIEVWQKIEYPTSPELARAHGVLSNAEMLVGNMVEAEQNARTRRDLLQREYGKTDEAVLDAEVDFASILLAMDDAKKAEEAKALLKPRLFVPLDAKFSDDEETALVRCLYARALSQTNQADEAVTQFDRGFRVLENTQTRPSLVVAGCMRDYGQVLLDSPRRSDGRKMLGDAEAELSALSRMHPRYLRVTSAQIEDIRRRISKAQ
jgi:tetratricopeptide (TPR) repeat protein